jgi:lipopolysaccharide export system permease protein
MKTFDRYIIWQYIHVFFVMMLSTFGLFMVIDGFSNVDAFQQGTDSTSETLMIMASYYTVQSSMFFDMTGGIIAVVAVMVVFALLYKNSEIQPILAAGTPVYRLLLPTVVGVMLINTLIILNQELVIPRLSERLEQSRGKTDSKKEKKSEPVYDYKTEIYIAGTSLNKKERCMDHAEFVLPDPSITTVLFNLKAEKAFFYKQTNSRSAGWLLKKPNTSFKEIPLTAQGKKFVHPVNSGTEIFINSDVGFFELQNRSNRYRYSSTMDLIKHINNESFAIVFKNKQIMYLHSRLTKPLMTVISIFIAIPIILRKESRGLVGNMAICTLVLGVIMGFSQLFSLLGSANIIPHDLAAWIPVIGSGSLAAWLSGMVQT